jgi:hypothetical protein
MLFRRVTRCVGLWAPDKADREWELLREWEGGRVDDKADIEPEETDWRCCVNGLVAVWISYDVGNKKDQQRHGRLELGSSSWAGMVVQLSYLGRGHCRTLKSTPTDPNSRTIQFSLFPSQLTADVYDHSERVCKGEKQV